MKTEDVNHQFVPKKLIVVRSELIKDKLTRLTCPNYSYFLFRNLMSIGALAL